ncbi:putative nuclease HARBI1 [Lucilia cuprina]|nr:putative nuclease HARBI1 [Lucilia cuprina]
MFSSVGFIEDETIDIERRVLRKSYNPLDIPNSEFVKPFRLNKETFTNFLDIISPHLRKRQRSTFIPPIFKLSYNLPGVVGCIDGTQVKIMTPSPDQKHHRKGYYSLNVMFICDHTLKIKFVDARYPDANHDSFIWKNSDAHKHVASFVYFNFSQPLESYLMTPFRTQSHQHDVVFNQTHAKVRNCIERCNWKAIQIVNVCCALHNICIRFGHIMDNIELTNQENDAMIRFN